MRREPMALSELAGFAMRLGLLQVAARALGTTERVFRYKMTKYKVAPGLAPTG